MISLNGIKAAADLETKNSISYHSETSALFFKISDSKKLEISHIQPRTFSLIKAMVHVFHPYFLAQRPVSLWQGAYVKYKQAKFMLQSVSAKYNKPVLELNVL